MKTVELKQRFTILKHDELPDYAKDLFIKANEMLSVSYSPYSNFKVAAALITDKGTVHLGCNQENASYPLCICAERVALYNAGANTPKETIKAMVIVAKNPAKPLEGPVTPCGACRQVIVEFEDKQKADMEIFLKGEDDEIYWLENGKILLPLSFSGEVL